MYFWNLKGLIQYWKDGKFTQRDSYNYLFANLCLWAIMQMDTVFRKKTASDGDASFLMKLIVVGVVLGIGFLVLQKVLSSYYRSNGGDGGTHFLSKLLSLWFVVTIRVSAVIFPLLILSSMTGTPGEPLSAMSLGILALLLIAAIGGFIYTVTTINNSLKEIRQASGGGSNSL